MEKLKAWLPIPFLMMLVLLTFLVPSLTTSAEEVQGITPARGDGNIDLDISAVNDTVLSGRSALFELNGRVTGNNIQYTNVVITVDLPKNGELATPLEDLEIANVLPEYDEANNRLTYNIPSLRGGAATRVILEYKTENGLDNGTEFTAVAELDADQLDLSVTPTQTTATVTVVSTLSKSVSKVYDRTENNIGQTLGRAPQFNDIGVWELRLLVPNNAVGQQYLLPGEKIIIEDELPTGLTYVSDDSGGVYDSTRRVVRWEFEVPSLEEQKASESIFNQTIILKTRFNRNITSSTSIGNKMTATMITSDGKTDKTETSSDVTQFPTSAAQPVIPPVGSVWAGTHRGPSDGLGNTTNSSINPNPTVGPDARIRFTLQTTNYTASSPTRAFDSFRIDYKIDPKLTLTEIGSNKDIAYNPYKGYNNTTSYSGATAQAAVKDDIYATVNGVERMIVKDVKWGTNYKRQDWLTYQDEKDHITNIRIQSKYRAAGVHTFHSLFFKPKPGVTGRATNRQAFSYVGYDVNGNRVTQTVTPDNEFMYGPTRTWGERYVNITQNTSNLPVPIIYNTIHFLNQTNGVIEGGTNTVRTTLGVDLASQASVPAPYSTYVLLPKNTSYNQDNPNIKFGGTGDTGTVTLVDENYLGGNRELVEIKWDRQTTLNPNQRLSVDFDIIVDPDRTGQYIPEAYSFVGTQRFTGRSYTSEAITNSVEVVDSNNLTGKNDPNYRGVLTKNSYRKIGIDRFTAFQTVKGELDDDYSRFGYTLLNGSADFKLRLDNLGDDATDFVLYDILPAVGDLGITDNKPTNSKFRLDLTGPITLPTATADEFEVFYSTSSNPSRKDLVENVNWPSTTTPYQDPPGAENPNWIAEADVTDWASINSFMVKSKPGQPIRTNEVLEINFNMRAPETLPAELLDMSVDPIDRAAFNSFAYTVNDLQPVEPTKVGVAINPNNFNLQVLKEDKETQERLQGTEFTLYDQDKTILDIMTSDGEGKVIFSNLSPGTYYLQETNAPSGYELISTMYEIEILTNGDIEVKNKDNWLGEILPVDDTQTISITFLNQKVYQLPETGSSRLVMSGIAGMMLLGVSLLYMKRQKEQY